jgi:hypothetical protein
VDFDAKLGKIVDARCHMIVSKSLRIINIYFWDQKACIAFLGVFNWMESIYPFKQTALSD